MMTFPVAAVTEPIVEPKYAVCGECITDSFVLGKSDAVGYKIHGQSNWQYGDLPMMQYWDADRCPDHVMRIKGSLVAVLN